jgi:50S ribosomal protein L16 3-hydroxylase
MNILDFTMTNFDPEHFFKEFWRTKPLFVPQGAKLFLEKNYDYEWFEQVKKKISQEEDQFFEYEGVVSFIERISEHDTHLSEQAKLLQSKFNFPVSWFDAIKTYHSTKAGIGTHFDHSDNFVLQQQGIKHWRLASEEYIPNELKAKRMLLRNQSGNFTFPVNCEIINFSLYT